MTFDLIAFDGDDTLWHNERVYRMGRERFREVLAGAGVTVADLEHRVNEIEVRNIKYYGYGVTSFVLSLIETAIEVTDGRITGAEIHRLLHLSREMIDAEVELFAGAREALAALAASYRIMLITKGDLLHQRAKVEQSGLGEYFAHVEVVSAKTADTYASILAKHAVEPARFLMVGNSLRSDILPVLEIGGWAVHIPAPLSWAHEDGDRPENAAGRFFDVEGLAQVPRLIGGLEGEGSQQTAAGPRRRY